MCIKNKINRSLYKLLFNLGIVQVKIYLSSKTNPHTSRRTFQDDLGSHHQTLRSLH